MTRKEASFILANIDRRVCDDELSDALDMSIKALEQEPCCNCIEFKRYAKEMGFEIEQEPKTGHWILSDEQNKEDVENDNYCFICSECGCSDIHAKGTIVPYCWKCGTKMEREEKQ